MPETLEEKLKRLNETGGTDAPQSGLEAKLARLQAEEGGTTNTSVSSEQEASDEIGWLERAKKWFASRPKGQVRGVVGPGAISAAAQSGQKSVYDRGLPVRPTFRTEQRTPAEVTRQAMQAAEAERLKGAGQDVTLAGPEVARRREGLRRLQAEEKKLLDDTSAEKLARAAAVAEDKAKELLADGKPIEAERVKALASNTRAILENQAETESFGSLLQSELLWFNDPLGPRRKQTSEILATGEYLTPSEQKELGIEEPSGVPETPLGRQMGAAVAGQAPWIMGGGVVARKGAGAVAGAMEARGMTAGAARLRDVAKLIETDKHANFSTRTLQRMKRGAIEGNVISPIIDARLAAQRGEDWESVGVMSFLMGTVIGAGAEGVGGAAADAVMIPVRRARKKWESHLLDLETQAAEDLRQRGVISTLDANRAVEGKLPLSDKNVEAQVREAGIKTLGDLLADRHAGLAATRAAQAGPTLPTAREAGLRAAEAVPEPPPPPTLPTAYEAATGRLEATARERAQAVLDEADASKQLKRLQQEAKVIEQERATGRTRVDERLAAASAKVQGPRTMAETIMRQGMPAMAALGLDREDAQDRALPIAVALLTIGAALAPQVRSWAKTVLRRGIEAAAGDPRKQNRLLSIEEWDEKYREFDEERAAETLTDALPEAPGIRGPERGEPEPSEMKLLRREGGLTEVYRDPETGKPKRRVIGAEEVEASPDIPPERSLEARLDALAKRRGMGQEQIFEERPVGEFAKEPLEGTREGGGPLLDVTNVMSRITREDAARMKKAGLTVDEQAVAWKDLGEDGELSIMVHRNNRPSEGPWRVSYFRQDEPVGHNHYATRERALAQGRYIAEQEGGAGKDVDYDEYTGERTGFVAREPGSPEPVLPSKRPVIANVELQTAADPSLNRFGELAPEARATLTRQAIETVLKPLARSEGLPDDVVEGFGSWFQNATRSITETGRYMLPANVSPEAVHRLLARASKALKQAGYFAARPRAGSGRWALEIDFGRPMSPTEYKQAVETISSGATTFGGTTMVRTDPARLQIVLNEGVDRAGIENTWARIDAVLPGETAMKGEAYEVETIEGYGDEAYRQVLDREGLSEFQLGVEREVDAAWESIRGGAEQGLARIDAARGAADQADVASVQAAERVAEKTGGQVTSLNSADLQRIGAGAALTIYAGSREEGEEDSQVLPLVAGMLAFPKRTPKGDVPIMEVARRLIRARPENVTGEGLTKILHGESSYHARPAKDQRKRAIDLGMRDLRRAAESTDAQVRKGGDWYRKSIKNMEKALVKRWPELSDTNRMGVFKALLAITSASTNPLLNMKIAGRLYENWRFGTGTGALTMNGPRVPGSIAQATIEPKLAQIESWYNDGLQLFGEDPDAAAKHVYDQLVRFGQYGRGGSRQERFVVEEFMGPKTGRYFLNLVGFDNYVTGDIWATRTLRRWLGYAKLEPRRVQLDDGTFGHLRDGDELVYALNGTPSDSEMEKLQDVFTELPRRFSLETKKKITPMDAQAMLWYYEKGLYKNQGAADSGMIDYADAARGYSDWADQGYPITGRYKRSDPTQGELPLGGATFYANPVLPAIQQLGKRGLTAATLGGLGLSLQAQEDNPDLHKTGTGLIIYAVLHALGSKNLMRPGQFAGRRIVEALRQGPKGRAVVRFMNPEALLSPEVKKLLEQARRTKATGKARGAELGEQAALAGPEGDRAISDVIEGEDWEAASAALINEVMPVAAEIAAEFDQLGARLVAAGALSPEAYAKHKGAYLPRKYAFWESLDVMGPPPETGAPTGTATRIRGTKERVLDRPIRDAELAIGQARTPAEVTAARDALDQARLEQMARRNELGEIRQASYRTQLGLTRGYSDLAAAELFKGLRAMPGTIEPGYLNAVDEFLTAKTMYQVATTKADRDTAEGLMNAATVEMDRLTRHYETLDGEWVPLPKTKGLGVMGGMVVRREIAQSLNDMPDWKGLGKLIHWWKKSKTIFNPGTHAANVVSNMNLAHVGGMNLVEQPSWLALARRDMAGYGPATRALAEAGHMDMSSAFPGGPGGKAGPRSAEGLARLRDNASPEMRKWFDEHHVPANETSTLKAIGDWTSQLYMNEDNIFRVAMYLKATQQGRSGVLWGMGKSHEDALQHVMDSFGDFRSKSPAIHLLRQTVAPFILWPAKVLPKFAANVVDHPWRYLSLVAIWAGVNEYSKSREGEVPESDLALRDRRGPLGYLLPGFIQLPFTGKEGEKAGVDISRWTPWSAVTTAAPPGTFAGHLGDRFPAIAAASGPLTDLAVKFAGNRDPFTGEELIPADYPAGEKAARVAEAAAQTVLPPWLGFHRKRIVEDIKNADADALKNDLLGPTGMRPRYVRPGANEMNATYKLQQSLLQMKKELNSGLLKSRRAARDEELLDQYEKRVEQAIANYERRVGAPPPKEVLQEIEPREAAGVP